MIGVNGTHLLTRLLTYSLTYSLSLVSNNTVTVEQALSDECLAAVDAGAELLGWINVYNIYGECTVQTTCTEAGNWSGDDDNSVASSAHLRQMESGVGASVEGITRTHSLIYSLTYLLTYLCRYLSFSARGKRISEV